MPLEVRERCSNVFRAPWGHCAIETTRLATIGAHSHTPGKGMLRTADDLVVVDGESSLYARLARPGARLWTTDASGVDLTAECRGNIAIWNEVHGRLAIANEWTGSFPLYYLHRPRQGFLFSSRMSVIESAIRCTVDALGLTEFLREACFFSDRSLWSNLRRLQPGQSLVYDIAADRVSITERSRLWTSIARTTTRDATEAIWAHLGHATDISHSTSLMMSGGWDSRTLLARAVASSPLECLTAYSHGDPSSREIRLAQRLAGESGIAFHQEPIDHRCYEIAELQMGFAREEHVVFPHWHRAGRIAAAAGPQMVMAGVYGEVLGGHYGRAMLLQGTAKVREVLRQLVGKATPSENISRSEFAALREFFHHDRVDRPWPIREDWWRDAQISADQLNADVDQDLTRLKDRGIHTVDQLIEAHVSEHRGSQYINAQVRSCRAYTEVSMPFAERGFLEAACAVPLAKKIHNRLNRELLRRYAPGLLRHPMAATLVAASRPLVVQEASRFARKGLELWRWRDHFTSGGRVKSPRLSWVNFEFLRTGPELRTIIDDLKADFWDKSALLERADQLARGASVPTHPMSDQVMKIYTIDLALRPA